MLDSIDIIVCGKCGVIFSTDKVEIKNEGGSFIEEKYICPVCKMPNDRFYVRSIVTDDN